MKNNTGKTKKTREIRAVKNADGKRLFGVHVLGNILKAAGIVDGDILVVKPVENFDETSLYVFDTPNGRTAKYAFEFLGDVTLHNKGKWFRRYKASDVKLLGVVVRVERDLEVLND